MNLYGRGRALRSRVVDTAAGNDEDDDDNDDDGVVDDVSEANTQTHKPPEKRRRSEPLLTKSSRQSDTTKARELRSTGPAKKRTSDSNLPRHINSTAAAAGL